MDTQYRHDLKMLNFGSEDEWLLVAESKNDNGLVEVNVVDDYEAATSHITKDAAINLIAHLKKVFDLNA